MASYAKREFEGSWWGGFSSERNRYVLDRIWGYMVCGRRNSSIETRI
jgi:hypothetical protein